MHSLTSFEELSRNLDKLQTSTTVGYHRTYYKNRISKAIADFDRFGIIKYIICAPKYRQLIKKAKQIIAKF